jgi:hypothetical protein
MPALLRIGRPVLLLYWGIFDGLRSSWLLSQVGVAGRGRVGVLGVGAILTRLSCFRVGGVGLVHVRWPIAVWVLVRHLEVEADAGVEQGKGRGQIETASVRRRQGEEGARRRVRSRGSTRACQRCRRRSGGGDGEGKSKG